MTRIRAHSDLVSPHPASMHVLNESSFQNTFRAQTIDSETDVPSFQVAELRSECARITALLTVFVSLLALVLIRGVTSLAQGRRGEAWPFALLLALMTAYEMGWLRFVEQAIAANREVSKGTWAVNIFIESLLPTSALFLQIHTSFVGPRGSLTSPVVLAYFIFILLSTLHLSPQLSRLTGIFAAAGYTLVSIYSFLLFPEAASSNKLLAYSTSFSYAAFMLIAGFAAGAVAQQISMHVIAALHEAGSRVKMEQDLSIARSIQQGLLPKMPPRVAGFDIAGWNQPADETGGDYFDWQNLTDGRLAVTIADVTGHGIGPAIGMAGCRAYARAGLAADTDLEHLLSRLNQLLCEDLPPGKFVTLAAGLLNPQEATLELISAGHGPLLFYSSQENRFRRYDAQGPPLGLLPDFAYRGTQRLKFAPGDILVLVTDGFIEWANTGDEEFGQNRIQEVIRTYRDMSSTRIISELYSTVVAFVGSMPQLDDLTVLIVKREQ